MIETLIIVIHVIVAVGLITLVLLQHGRGADAGAAFGSGASATIFGARGAANFLSHLTAGLATLFFVTSLSLGYLYSHRNGVGSVTEKIPVNRAPVTQPVNPLPQSDKPDLPPAANTGQQPAGNVQP
jgi:preprotein translocase subunit SecG